MSTVSKPSQNDVPYACLRNGDCMLQKEFHRLYDQMPQGFRAELVEGIVYVAEPLGTPHAGNHLRLGSTFDAYQASTPGVWAGADVSVILSDLDEVQPDLSLRVLPNYGGQSGGHGHGHGQLSGRSSVRHVREVSITTGLLFERRRSLELVTLTLAGA